LRPLRQIVKFLGLLIFVLAVVMLLRLAFENHSLKQEGLANEMFHQRLKALELTWPVAKTAEECLRLKGTFRKLGNSASEICVIPTNDAQKSCKVNSDCEAFCDLSSKKCHPEFNVLGHCFELRFNEEESMSRCID